MLRRSLWVVFAVCASLEAQAADKPPACADAPEYHRLDFWLGDWDVYVGGTLDGRNQIVAILNGCAVQENWSDASGYEGKSWFFVNPATHHLRQVWLTSVARMPGGTKEKSEVSSEDSRSIRFQGAVLASDGSTLFDRTTLTPGGDGTVRQLIETSHDARHWTLSYDAVYRRTASE
jgi:hypothetical protein